MSEQLNKNKIKFSKFYNLKYTEKGEILMAKKVFTDESLATLINEIKTYIDERVSSLASQVAYIDESDDETVTLSDGNEVLY